ncbi:glycosyl hydrolase [Halpernia sp.]|uniref:sialidase family protein n=1 Tax=Halpernia sp. TaxID=2782209 RepID=UPI003A95C3AB
MKTKISILIFLSSITFLKSQTLKFETLLQDKISIRALQVFNNKVYYSGTDSKFGFVDLKNTESKKQVILSDKKLQFRTLAQDKNSFYTINIESPAYFFKIDKKTLDSKIIFIDTTKTAFYDALQFENDGNGIALGDPNGKCMSLVKTKNSGKTWEKLRCSVVPKVINGEAAFAASNSNIFLKNGEFWFVTGGMVSRQYYSHDFGKRINVKKLDFVDGTSSTGIYSLDLNFNNRFGIAVGGDYTKQADNINNIATTFNGGETWQIQASGKNAGYMTCVKIRPGSNGKEIIAVGDQHISYSDDFGKTWTKISDEKNLYVVDWVDKNNLVFAGKDRILKAYFNN